MAMQIKDSIESNKKTPSIPDNRDERG